ncbi:PHB depolymerase family esterase [Fluviicola sp.]|uniref:extracellular catalytic domain type 1 short-chain-length polyhydroxyalkanoate depolymerase n=1 Tax=Fluviicola sp. TaxID=1917219 RepID=UPI0031DE7C7D
MKATFIIALLIAAPSALFSQLTDISSQLTENKGNLNGYLHEPASKQNGKRPLILVLHGCNQDAKEISEGSGWNELADAFGFYVIYPEQKSANNLFRCFNWFLKDDQEKDKGEMASIHEMVQYAVSHYSIDESRVYIYGVSAGAMMSVSYMACYPAQIKSGAILAGSAYKQVDSPKQSFSEMRKPTVADDEILHRRLYSQDSLYTGEFPQLIVVHGTDDKVVNYANSEVLVKQWKTAFDIVSESEEKVPVGKILRSLQGKITKMRQDVRSLFFTPPTCGDITC